MNHPPIPPKDKRTLCLKNGLLTEYTFNLRAAMECHFPHSIAVYDPPDAWRPVLAAYYEVEWRKRAERWEKLFHKYHQYFQVKLPNGVLCDGVGSARSEAFRKPWNEAKANALAWRAWGSTK